MTDDGKILTVTVPLVYPNGYTEYLRLSRWNDRIWMHVLENENTPTPTPGTDDDSLYYEIALTTESAHRLGLLLIAATGGFNQDEDE